MNSKCKHPSALLLGLALLSASILTWPAKAADKVSVTSLQDIDFGIVGIGSGNLTTSQNLCVYSGSKSGSYSVRATGSGSGGALALQSPSGQLPFEVQWADAANSSAGRLVQAAVVEGGFTSQSKNRHCNSGPTASLIVILRDADLSAATAGNYTGHLTVLIAPL